jgi:hypothetical protein
MELNPRSLKGLDNIRQFILNAHSANLLTHHESSSLLSLCWRLGRHLDACIAPISSKMRELSLHVDVFHGMQVALLMTCLFIRDRAKARLEEAKDLIEVYDGNIFGQEAILQEAIVTRNKLAEERNALQKLI